MDIETRLEREIELIEKDESLTREEKDKEIRELYKEAREYEREEMGW